MALFDQKKRIVDGINSFGKEKTPPGQVATVKFPVLTYGSTPTVEKEDWRFRVWGEVEEELVWTWDEFMKFPQTKLRADFHCVTHWSRFDEDRKSVV